MLKGLRLWTYGLDGRGLGVGLGLKILALTTSLPQSQSWKFHNDRRFPVMLKSL